MTVQKNASREVPRAAVSGVPRSRHVESDLMTVPEAADYLRLGRSTIYNLMEQGKVPRYKMGGAVRLSKNDLDTFRESCRIGSLEG
jgi:excisionase family DNA binding protein